MFKRAVLILFQNFPPKGNQFFYDPNYHDPSYEYGGYGFTGQMNPFSHYKKSNNMRFSSFYYFIYFFSFSFFPSFPWI